MLIGVPKEIKPAEYRVGLTPTAVREYVAHGHRVLVETGAGDAIDAPDAAYRAAGAAIAIRTNLIGCSTTGDAAQDAAGRNPTPRNAPRAAGNSARRGSGA